MEKGSKAPAGGRVTVVGAGIVGVCCGLYLLRRGYEVSIVDFQEPGEGSSQGNAGFISPGSCAPIGMPGLAAKVPGMLLDPLGPLTIRWSYLHRIAPWLLRFIAASSPARVERISDALRALYRSAVDDFAPLIDDAKAGRLIRHEGRLEVYKDEASLHHADLKFDLYRRRGVEFEMLDAAQLHDLLPALSPEYRIGVSIPGSSHTTDPFRLTQVLAEDFRKRGGKILRGKIVDFELGPSGPRRVISETGSHDTEAVVVAAGAY